MHYLLKILIFGTLLLSACSPLPTTSFQGARPQVKGGVEGKATGGGSSAVMIIPKKGTNAQPVRPKKPTLDWLSPDGSSARIGMVAEKITVRVRVSSSEEIQLNQLEILVDGAPPGNKADEVSLLRRAEFKDQIMTFQVPITFGRHQVQIVLTMAGDERYLAERTFIRDATGVKILDSTPVSSTTRITWTKPDVFVLRDNEIFATKKRELEVRFNITTPNPLQRSQLRILQNQVYREPSSRAAFRGENGTYYFRDWITLDEDVTVNEIGLRADETNGYSLSQRLKVNFAPQRPNLYVLAVGPKLNLDFSDQDAADFGRAFGSQGARAHRLFNQVTVDTLLGEQATTQNIRLAIASIRNKLRTGVILEDDIVVLFFSTHGFLLEGDLYLQANDYQSYAATETSIAYKAGILDKIEGLPCRKLVFIDACHSAGARANTADLNQALADLKTAPRGLAVFASSSADEQSYEDARWGNGAFTEAILQGLLEGKADSGSFGNNNGIITLTELERYVKKTVPPLVKTIKQKGQHPTLTRNELGDIPLFIHR
jgi:hypothetical protein